jgi:hypothetical protein
MKKGGLGSEGSTLKLRFELGGKSPSFQNPEAVSATCIAFV